MHSVWRQNHGIISLVHLLLLACAPAFVASPCSQQYVLACLFCLALAVGSRFYRGWSRLYRLYFLAPSWIIVLELDRSSWLFLRQNVSTTACFGFQVGSASSALIFESAFLRLFLGFELDQLIDPIDRLGFVASWLFASARFDRCLLL